MSATESATAPTRESVTPSSNALGASSSPKIASESAAAAIPTPCPMIVLRGLPTSAVGVSKIRNAVAPRLGNSSGSSNAQAARPLSAIANSEPMNV